MDVPPAHAISDMKPWRQLDVLLRLGGSEEQLASDRWRQRRCRLYRNRIGSTTLDLGAGDDPALDERVTNAVYQRS
jgi:hypothetical protein